MSVEAWVKRVLVKLAAIGIQPADESGPHRWDMHEQNIREYYGMCLNPKATDAEVTEFEQKKQDSVTGRLSGIHNRNRKWWLWPSR